MISIIFRLRHPVQGAHHAPSCPPIWNGKCRSAGALVTPSSETLVTPLSAIRRSIFVAPLLIVVVWANGDAHSGH